MAASPLPPVELAEPERTRHQWQRRRTAVAIVVVLVVSVVALLASHWWPFSQQSIVQRLQDASDSKVSVRGFHRTYFPYPGCVLDGVAFTRGTQASQPLITIQKLTIRATYPGMLRHHVSHVIADGMHVLIPASGNAQRFQPRRSNVTIGEISAKDATLEFERKSGNEPLRFDVHEISLRDVGWSGPLNYQVKLHNPSPPAEVTAAGKFGLWNQNDPAQTPISGEYKLEHADLSVYHGIAGLVTATGKFSGVLGHIDISGRTDTPNFEIKTGKHPVPLMTEFTAYVNGTNGDTFLKHVDAYFLRTHVVADGSIAKFASDKGKVARINLSARDGRIEDVLWLFVKSSRPPMSGVLNFQAKAELPPGHERFLQKVTLRGIFGVGGGEFPNSSTQQRVDKLSAGARGDHSDEDPETVLTDLAGQVALVKGVANFNDITFGVPGAKARMRGTYSLIDRKIDLRGQMKVDTQIANTTTGVKSLLLRVMGPFFKHRKRGGQILPVKISGTYEKPSFGLDLEDEKAEAVPAPHTYRGPGARHH